MFKFFMHVSMLLSISVYCGATAPVNPITLTFQAGTTTFAIGQTGTASYLVRVDPAVVPPGYPVTMSVNNLPNWVTQITAGGTECTTTTATCPNLMSLSAGETCCLKLSLNGANLTAGNYSIAPILATTPPTYQGQAPETPINVINVPQITTISMSPSASSPQILTADGVTPLVFTITNTGTSPAINITATQPPGWSGVNITTSPGCTSLPPASSNCTLTLTSSTPNLAKQFTVQALNTGAAISSPYVAFRTHGGLVFSISGTSPNATAKVVAEDDNSAAIQWYNGTFNNTGATSITDGYYTDPLTNSPDLNGNTYIITHAATFGLPNDPATYAAAVCYNDVSGAATPGDWYLPAICELGTYDPNTGGTDASCGSNIPNIESNLFNYGFLNNLTTGTLSYWSSSENGQFTAWYQFFISVGSSSTQYADKDDSSRSVRCTRAFKY